MALTLSSPEAETSWFSLVLAIFNVVDKLIIPSKRSEALDSLTSSCETGVVFAEVDSGE